MLSHRSAGKRAALRESLWPKSKGKIWPPPKGENGAKGEGGWARVPRTISAISRAFAEESKGVDLLGTYIELLARTPEEGIVEIASEEEHAVLAGFAANPRGVKSWRTRIRALEELGFIRVFAETRPIGFVVMVHPTQAMQALRNKKRVSDAVWAQFSRIAIDTGVGPAADEPAGDAEAEKSGDKAKEVGSTV
jgi:hypothetical protein